MIKITYNNLKLDEKGCEKQGGREGKYNWLERDGNLKRER